ncbi:hypothetical protein BGZ93_009327 [Podila epicladia]|nr:hypothetical protein BGZ93_009327 [Podila epicladia]
MTPIRTEKTPPTLATDPLYANPFNITSFSPQPYSSSGFTAILYAKTLATTVPEINEYAGSMELCIVFAHLLSVQCLGSCIALARWTWYIYRSLRRKRGVVDPKLINVLQVNQPRGSDTSQNHNGPEFAPGFSFRRPFSSLADIQFRLPACVITPVVMLMLLLREIWKHLFFCCFPKRVVPYRHGADLDDNELFENWPKYPSQLEEIPQVPGSQSSQRSQRGSDAICVAHSGSGPSAPPLTTLAAKLGVDQVDLSNPSIEEITYGYDISGLRIKYTQDSWHHHFKQKVQNHRKILDEVIVCIVWPLVLVLVLFFVKMPGRSYELYTIRGGCGLPKEGGRADYITVMTIDAASTVFSAMGCLLAVLSCRLFQVQNGNVTLKIKSLTPSPAVIQLLKSTILVRNFLNLSLVLNILVFISRLAHLAASGIRFQSLTPHTDLPRPLFNVAGSDFAIFTVFVSMVVALLTLLSLTWKKWSHFSKTLCRFFARYGVGPEADHSDDTSKTQFPFYEMHRMEAVEKNPETGDGPPRGIWAKSMAALYARRVRKLDGLDCEERGGNTAYLDPTSEETIDHSENEVHSCPDISREIAPASYLHDFALSMVLETPPKAASLKIKSSRESAPSYSGSSRYSVSKKRLPSLPKDPDSSVLSSKTLDIRSLCPRSACSHGDSSLFAGSEGRDMVRSLSPRPQKPNPGKNARNSRDSVDSKVSSIGRDTSLAFTETQRLDRRPSAGSTTVNIGKSSHHTSSRTRCKCRSDCHRHHHHPNRRYHAHHPMQEDACSFRAYRIHHTHVCDRASNRSVRRQTLHSRHARPSCAQYEDSIYASESTSSSEYEDEISAEEFGVTNRNNHGGSKLISNQRMQEVAKFNSISTPEVQRARLQCSRHRRHHSTYHRASVPALYMLNHSQRTSENSVTHHKSRTRHDDRYGHPSPSQLKLSRYHFNDEHDHHPAWKSFPRKAYAASVLTCSAITDKHGQAASSDSPLVPPHLRAHAITTSSSQNSLLSTPSSFQTTAALEDSDIEHSATISQRRHMSDSALATNLKMKSSSSGEYMIYNSELGCMISLPKGKRPPLRSSSSASITSHLTTGTFRGLQFSKEPLEPSITAAGSASLISSSLTKGSQEYLQNVVVVGSSGILVKKVSSRMLNKIYRIMPKEEAARKVQMIAPAPQIRPPEPPGLVKSNVAAQGVVAPVSALASSVAITVTPLTPPSSLPSMGIQIV